MPRTTSRRSSPAGNFPIRATRAADAQYDDEQYQTTRGWGHSSCFSATDFASRAEANHLAL